MAIKIKNDVVIDDNKNVIANNYNGYIPANQSTSIVAGNGLIGGGNLSANRTLSVNVTDGLVANSLGVHVNTKSDGGLSKDSTGLFVDSSVVRTTRTLSNGAGISGGGDLSANRTISVVAGNGIVANATGVHVNSDVLRTYYEQTINNTKTFDADVVMSDFKYTAYGINSALPTRRNLLIWSQDFTKSRWWKRGAVISGPFLAPDSTNTAYKTTFPLNNTSSWVQQNYNFIPLRGYTFSAYYKHSGAGTGVVRHNIYTFETGDIYVNVDLTTGAIVSYRDLNLSDITITNAGNGWWRVAIYKVMPATITNCQTQVGRMAAGVGDDISGPYIWGAQLELEALTDYQKITLQNDRYLVSTGWDGNFVTFVSSASSVYRNIANTDNTYDVFTINNVNGNVGALGTITASGFSGSGSSLTALNASNISTGTIADARIPSNIVRTTFSLINGNGISGGGDLSANRTISVVAGDGIVSNTTGVHVNSTVVRTTGTQTITGEKTFDTAPIIPSSKYLKLGITNSQPNVEFGWNGEDLMTNMKNGFFTIQNVANASAPESIFAVNSVSGNTYVKGQLTANTFVGDGSSLTALNGSNISTGTIADARIPTNIVRNTISLVNGNGISGGGDLSTNRTISVVAGDGIVSNATGVHVNSTVVRNNTNQIITGNVTATGFIGSGASLTALNGSNITTGTIADARIPSNIVRDTITLVNGNGITGGGNLSTNRTLSVVAGDGIVSNTTGVHVNSTVVRTTGIQTITGEKIFTGPVSIQRPSDYKWTHSMLRVSDLGQFASHSDNDISMTSNGYRSANDMWISGFINNSNGASQISLRPYGEILFKVDSSKLTGSSYNVTTRGGVNELGFFGGGINLTSLNAANISTGTIADARIPTNIVRDTITLSNGNGISGGGDLSANRTISVVAGDGIVSNATGVHVNSTVVRNNTNQIITGNVTATGFIGSGASLTALNGSNITTGTIADARIPTNIVRNTISLANGNGISGGGDLSANRTISVVAGDGIISNSTGVHVNSTVVRTTGTQTISGLKTLNDAFHIPTATYAKYGLTNGVYLVEAGWNGGNFVNFMKTGNFIIQNTNAAPDNVFIVNAVTGEGFYKGAVSATGFIGSGASLTSLNAANISTGTIADARIPTNIVRDTITLSNGNGIAGGGNLSTNRTISVVAGGGVISNATGVHVNAGQGLVTNSTGLHVVAGAGLSSNTSGLWVGAGDGINVLASSISVNSTVVRTSNTDQTILGIKTFNDGLTIREGFVLNMGNTDFIANSTVPTHTSIGHSGNHTNLRLRVGDLVIIDHVTNVATQAVTATNRFRFFRETGNFTASGEITAYSDARLKTEVKTLDSALDKVKKLRGVEFKKDDKKSIGVIAQEIREVLPEVVHENDEGYLSVAYGNIVGLLIEAIKELEEKIEAKK